MQAEEPEDRKPLFFKAGGAFCGGVQSGDRQLSLQNSKVYTVVAVTARELGIK